MADQQPKPKADLQQIYDKIDKISEKDKNFQNKLQEVFLLVDPEDLITKDLVIDRVYIQLSKNVYKSTLQKIYKAVWNNGATGTVAEQEKEENYEFVNHMVDNHLICTLRETDVICKYNGGFFHRDCLTEIREDIADYFETNDLRFAINRQKAVLELIRAKTFVSHDEFDADPNIINVANGTIDISNFSFTPHKKFDENPYLSFRQLNVKYVENAECPNFDKFLDQVFGSKRRELIYQMIGYSMTSTVKYHKAFMLYGSGANGKTTFLNVLEEIFTDQNISRVALHEMEEDYQLYNMAFSLINIVDDIPNKPLEFTGNFKRVVSNDKLEGKIKYVQARQEWLNKCKLWFACNQLPFTKDTTEAFWRRWILVPCYSVFKDKFTEEEKKLTDEERVKRHIYKKDPDMIKKIITEDEKSGILWNALKGIMKLQADGSFPKEWDDIEFVKEMWFIESNPIKKFISDCCDIKSGKKIDKKKLYEAFTEHRQAMKLDVPAQQQFTTRMKQLKGVNDKTVSASLKRTSYPSGSIFTGVGLKDDWEQIVEEVKNPDLELDFDDTKDSGEIDIDALFENEDGLYQDEDGLIRAESERKPQEHDAEEMELADDDDLSEDDLEEAKNFLDEEWND